MMPASTPRDFASIQGKIEVYQRALRDWSKHLTGNEVAVVAILIDRTVGWGRREAYFTIRAMLKGDGVYSGLNMSERTMFRVLASLETKGLIRRRKDRNVPDRVHFTVNSEWKPDSAGSPKGHRSDCQDGSTPCHIGSPVCQDGSLYTGITKQVSNTGSLPGATAPVSLAILEKVRVEEENNCAASDEPMPTLGQGSPQSLVESVEAAWRLALIETFPGTAYRTWGVREKAQIKTVLKMWRGDVRFPFFVDWAVRNWTAIMKKHFKWMTKEPPPSTPALSFLIRFLDKFGDCRAEGVLDDWLSAKGRTEIEKMMGRGQTYEQSVATLGKQHAVRALRAEMEKREVHARSRDYAATRKLAEAEKLAALEARVPIHPQSELAKQMRAAAIVPPVKLIEVDGSAADAFRFLPTGNPFDD